MKLVGQNILEKCLPKLFAKTMFNIQVTQILYTWGKVYL